MHQMRPFGISPLALFLELSIHFFFCHTNKNNANLFIWDLENGKYDGTHPKVLEERIRIDFKVLG